MTLVPAVSRAIDAGPSPQSSTTTRSRVSSPEAAKTGADWYEPMDPALLPPLYVEHHETLGEPTEVFHNNIRERFNRGDQAVVGAMTRCAELAANSREALLARDTERLARLINTNFDTRRSIYHLPQWQVDMVETARRAGASAKFAGSGGTILGMYDGEAMFATVRDSLAAIGSRTIKPQVSD